MLISRLSLKRYKVANKVKRWRRIRIGDHTPKPIQTHEDCGYGYKVVCCYDDKYSKYTRIYRGENAVYKFMEKMLEEVEYCKAVIKKHFNKPLVMTEVDEQCFKTMDRCHICGEMYTDKDVRVRDHFHITGKFRGSGHQDNKKRSHTQLDSRKQVIAFQDRV